MKTISKLLMWLCIVVIVFFGVIFLIWVFKYGGINSYVHMLNDKERNQEKESLTWNPTTWFDLLLNQETWDVLINMDFPIEDIQQVDVYVDWEDASENTDDINDFVWNPQWMQDVGNDENLSESEQKVNPYDPDFEDEFYDYFFSE